MRFIFGIVALIIFLPYSAYAYECCTGCTAASQSACLTECTKCSLLEGGDIIVNPIEGCLINKCDGDAVDKEWQMVTGERRSTPATYRRLTCTTEKVDGTCQAVYKYQCGCGTTGCIYV